MPFEIGLLLYPGLTQLDLTGPFEVLHRLPDARVHLVSKTLDPVRSDSGLGLLPTTRMDACPALDLVFVPGGYGQIALMSDAEVLDFLRRQAAGARYVTSVCTGALLLGAAGLLAGYEAATHWAYTDLLPLLGATHEKGRVVRDGHVFTSGGVTSGIDFAFRIIAELAGPEVAQAIQLGIEYDPSPPFDAGHPDKASEAAIALMVHRNATAHAGIRRALEALKA